MTDEEVRQIVAKYNPDSVREDYYSRRQRERRQAREAEQREAEAKTQRASASWAAVDQRIAAHGEQNNHAVAKAVGEYIAATRMQLRKEMAEQKSELEAKIAELERRIEARALAAANRFEFKRAGLADEPARMARKTH